MILTLVSILVTIACLAIILSIIVRHWHVLSSIDVDALPQTRDAKTKKRIMSDRLRRQFHGVTATMKTRAEPLSELVRERTAGLRNAFWDALETLSKKRKRDVLDKEEEATPSSRVERTLAAAETLFEDEKFEEAEKRYIDIIAQDAKNLDAYEGLSWVYVRQKEWSSAQEVLEFLTAHLHELCRKENIDPSVQSTCEMRLAKSLMELSNVYRMRENKEAAERSIIEAVELQPQNPKFLDAMLEMYIILAKKREARAALSRLRDANPENQKLEEFEARIENL